LPRSPGAELEHEAAMAKVTELLRLELPMLSD
jgi:hypothetical protein